MDTDESEDRENELLLSCRHGDHDRVQVLLEQDGVNINCKGKSKANFGWSPLHLASYFGHLEVVQLLLEHDADVNVVNNCGDTPLHKAAHTGRMEMVMLLLKSNADVGIINAEGQAVKHIARNSEIKAVIEAAESVSQRKAEAEFMQAALRGDTELLATMLKNQSHVGINCTDSFGNTALHTASYRGQKAAAVLLLQNGIDTSIKNAKGQTALDMAKDAQMRQLLDVRPIKELQKNAQRFEGPLMKRTKLIGWKVFWVVLDRGVLSFFRNRADASTGARRKLFRYLDNAKVVPRTDVAHIFLIHFSNSTSLTLAVEADSSAFVQRQKWENSLGEHIAYSSHLVRQAGNVSDSDDELENIESLGSMQDALQSAQAHQQVLEKQVSQVSQAVETLTEASSQVPVLQIRVQLAQIIESSRDMSNSLTHCLTLFTQQEELRRLQLQQEVEKSRVLQDALHILAQEHHELEQTLGGHHSPITMYDDADDDDTDEFFDCDDAGIEKMSSSFKEVMGGNGDLALSVPTASSMKNGDVRTSTEVTDRSRWGGRCRLPVPMFSRHDFSVWSILKQCIGKELSKITMPVIFNEPLSFLQRITEYAEYAPLILRATACEDPIQRHEYIAAFAVSACASNWDRLGKPFNPLLGETYELDREDLGFKLVAEQVSHHPPVSAFYVSSEHYSIHGAIHPKLKFWGKSVEVVPKGTITLTLHRWGESYTWQNVNCCVHNIIVGKLWIEHRNHWGPRVKTLVKVDSAEEYKRIRPQMNSASWRIRPPGEFGLCYIMFGPSYLADHFRQKHGFLMCCGYYGTMEIVNHQTKRKAVLNFKPCGWTGKDLHKVEGFIFDKNKKKLRAFYGKWVEALYTFDMEAWDAFIHSRPHSLDSPALGAMPRANGVEPTPKPTQPLDTSSNNTLQVPDEVPQRGSTCNLGLPNQRLLWVAEPRAEENNKYFSFTMFAMMLNELEEDKIPQLPPTDCRLRPDIRKLEEGDMDGAAAEKHRLEEKQRAARKERKKRKDEWKPRWFRLDNNPVTGKEDWLFNNEYWDRKWDGCPDIF